IRGKISHTQRGRLPQAKPPHTWYDPAWKSPKFQTDPDWLEWKNIRWHVSSVPAAPPNHPTAGTPLRPPSPCRKWEFHPPTGRLPQTDFVPPAKPPARFSRAPRLVSRAALHSRGRARPHGVNAAP